MSWKELSVNSDLGALSQATRAASPSDLSPASGSSRSGIANAPRCIECGGAAKLANGRAIYPHRPDLYHKSFWLCACGAYCGCHPNTTNALGSPCGPVTRKARSAAHAAFDPLWRSKKMTRQSAYAWLTEATGIPRERCHMGMMTADEARRVVAAVEAMGRAE